MERHFAPLHRLLDDNGTAGPELAATLDALDEVHSLLNGLAQANQPEQTAYELARQRMNGRSDALPPLENAEHGHCVATERSLFGPRAIRNLERRREAQAVR